MIGSSEDIDIGQSDGVSLRFYPDGIHVTGWYDGCVGIEGGFVPWKTIDEWRKKEKRRHRWAPA